jgi:hypothetical protein
MSSDPATRRVRPTLRCLRDDLAAAVPAPSERIDDLAHRVMRKANDLAPAYPANQIRILEIADPFVFRFTHGRDRVITWLDEDRNIMWLCGSDLRRADDDYDRYVEMYGRSELLPAEEDDLRLEDETLLQLAFTIRGEAPRWLAEARQGAGTECSFELPGGAPVLVFVRPGASEEVWVALPTMLAEELGIADTVRGLIVATITELLGGPALTDCEQRSDWPTGRALRNYELAYFWVK